MVYTKWQVTITIMLHKAHRQVPFATNVYEFDNQDDAAEAAFAACQAAQDHAEEDDEYRA